MKQTLVYEIVDICYNECDAILVVKNKRYYFQFNKEPTIEEALEFFKRDSKFYQGEIQ